MENRYNLINFSIFEEEACTKMLEEEAKKGWMLEKAGLVFFKFKRSEPRQLKFFIDYNPACEDYLVATAEFGYTFIDNYETFSFWYSEDANAPQMQNDPVVKAMAIKARFKTWRIITMILIALVLSIVADPFLVILEQVRFDLGGFILYSSQVMFMVIFDLIALALLLQAVCQIYVRRKVSREVRGLDTRMKGLHAIKTIYNIALVFIAVLIIPFVWTTFNSEPTLMLYGVGWLVLTIVSMRTYRKKILTDQKIADENIRVITMMAILIILPFALFNFAANAQDDDSSNEVTSLQSSNFNNGSEVKTLFYNELSFYGGVNEKEEYGAYRNNYAEEIYYCNSEIAAKAIFEYQVEEVVNEIQVPGEIKDESSGGLYDPNRFKIAIPYEEAVILMNAIESEKIDFGYFLDDTYVIIKDNKVLYVELNRDYRIGEVIDHYL